MAAQDDLKFSALVLTKHPKSPETFSHRFFCVSLSQKKISISVSAFSSKVVSRYNVFPVSRKWTLTYLMEQNQNAPNNVVNALTNVSESTNEYQKSGGISQLIQIELDVCTSCAAKYPNNYNAWSHRIWLVQNFTENIKAVRLKVTMMNICRFHPEQSLQSADLFSSLDQVLQIELQFTTDWMMRNKSDYSGYHYRQFILTTAISLQQSVQGPICDTCSILLNELRDIGDNIEHFPGHESLWSHR